ncbi:MAG: hypothetical protein ACPGVU_17295, partial [Limisphaerales bacterium]
DLFRAAQSAPVKQIYIPKGTIMPAMSSRKNGKPRNMTKVLWAGEKPITASAFKFVSKGRNYRCVMPWPCSNFFLEDHGPAATTLSIECQSPERQFTGRPMKICFVVKNTGVAMEPAATVTVPIPNGATVEAVSDGAMVSNGRIVWTISNLAPGKGQEVCASMTTTKTGPIAFNALLDGENASVTDCACETKVLGVYALLVEVIDKVDPIRFGDEIEYVVTATNQGHQSHTNLKVVAELPATQEFVSGSGDSSVSATGKTVTMAPVPTLLGKATATWTLKIRAVNTIGATDLTDSRFVTKFSSDQITNPIREEEATQLY